MKRSAELAIAAMIVCLVQGELEATAIAEDTSAQWVTYPSVSSLLENPPDGAVYVQGHLVGRVPYECGLWVGKVQSNGYMYVGLPDANRLLHLNDTLQVLVTQSERYEWRVFDPSLGFPIPDGTVEGGFTDDNYVSYVCEYEGVPGTFVVDTGCCWIELHGTKSGPSFNILVFKDAESDWVQYTSVSAMLQNPPTGAVYINDLMVARVPYACGLWVGKVHQGDFLYVGIPDGRRLLHWNRSVQVLVNQSDKYEWRVFDPSLGFPIPDGTVEGGFTDDNYVSYVCEYEGVPGTFVVDTGSCWTEVWGVICGSTFNILVSKDAKSDWVLYNNVSALLQEPPTGAVYVNSLLVARVPYACGLWVGKVQPNGYMYVGIPDGSRLVHWTGAVQVLVTQQQEFEWYEFDPRQGFPRPYGTLEAGFTSDGNVTYVCECNGRPGTWVVETDLCWTEYYGSAHCVPFNILAPKHAEADWVLYDNVSALLQDPPTGAVYIGSLLVARVPYAHGLWVGKVQQNGYMYIGIPDGSRLLHWTNSVQVLVMDGESHWIDYDSANNFPVPKSAVKAGYTETGENTYVCQYMGYPGTFVPGTGQCWIEKSGVKNSSAFKILQI